MSINYLRSCSSRRLFLLRVHLLYIELQLFTLQDVAIAAACLTWTGSDASQKTTGVELVCHLRVDNAVLAANLELGSDVLGLLALLLGLFGLLNLLLVEIHVVVLKVPHSEWVRINLDNAVFDDRCSSDQLVVRSIVLYFKHS